MIKEILQSVQTQLGDNVPELKYVDKDWGQLSHAQPAVKFPCMLLDIEDVSYSQIAKGGQMADTQITLTIADSRLTSSSLTAPKKEDAYKVIDLIEKVHTVLQNFTNGNYAPLFRTSLKKVLADSGKECYKIVYQTAYMEGAMCQYDTTPTTGVKIVITEGEE